MKDIEVLRHKRQLNVQEQNALSRQELIECAQAYRDSASHLAWVEPALLQSGLHSKCGVLLRASTTPCGGAEESAKAVWLTHERQFYKLEATVSLGNLQLLSIDSCENVTAATSVSARAPGKGKSFGCLALEVLVQLTGADAQPALQADAAAQRGLS